MKKSMQKYSVLYLFILFAASCSPASDKLAPKNIYDYLIAFDAKKATFSDPTYLNKIQYADFGRNGRYKARLQGKIDSYGDYTYHRIQNNVGSLVYNYSDSSDEYSVKNIQTIMVFTDHSNGKWLSKYNDTAENVELGTFRILRHGYN